ncbi:MAG: Rid family hydrolase [Geminicoccaceae bacterium]
MASRKHVLTGSRYEELAGYARAVIFGDHVWVSGTVGYDFRTGHLPETAEGQAEQAIATIAWSLAEAGSSLEEVVRVRVFVPDPTDVEAVSGVMKKHFGRAKPANTTVCSPLAVPECKVEIEVEAMRGSALP